MLVPVSVNGIINWIPDLYRHNKYTLVHTLALEIIMYTESNHQLPLQRIVTIRKNSL